MLTRLISARQVVVLYHGTTGAYLFYCGQVYSQSAEYAVRGLPRHQRIQYCPIWALVDMDFQKHGPPLTGSSNLWPIQASSPDPIRWKSWLERNGATLLGMPLWNTEELMEGYAFGQFSLSAIEPGHVI